MPPGDPSAAAVALGGPLDGTVLGSAAADSYEVVMADGSRHRYERTEESGAASGPVGYAWAGRVGA